MAEKNALDALLGASIEVEDTVFIKRLGVDFRVKGLTGDVINGLREQCTHWEGKGTNRKQVIKEEELGNLLIATACIDPDFNNPKLLEKYGARDAADCVQKALLFGEVASLSSAVLDVSEVGVAEEDVEEAKN